MPHTVIVPCGCGGLFVAFLLFIRRKGEMTRRLFVQKPASYTLRAAGTYLAMDGAFRAFAKRDVEDSKRQLS